VYIVNVKSFMVPVWQVLTFSCFSSWPHPREKLGYGWKKPLSLAHDNSTQQQWHHFSDYGWREYNYKIRSLV
jgi:hypothetical protein